MLCYAMLCYVKRTKVESTIEFYTRNTIPRHTVSGPTGDDHEFRTEEKRGEKIYTDQKNL